MNNKIDELVNSIKDSNEYKEIITIKDKMNKNTELMKKINKVKVLQKKYLRYQDSNVEEELNNLVNELNNIPIYVEYNQRLDKVNQMINYVNDEINDYFYKLFNE